MKMTLLTVLFAVNAFAYSRPVTYTQFTNAAKEAAQLVENTDCSLRVIVNRSSLSLRIVNSKRSVLLTVPVSSKITVDGKEEFDGSFSRTYSIANQGTFNVTHVDDAYDSVTLYNAQTKQKMDCTVDY